MPYPAKPADSARNLARRRLRRGFSLFELLIAVIAISVLATILLNRLTYYQEVAEKAEMEYTISALKSALRLHLATLMVEGRLQEAAHLAQQNPMDWLERKPANYAGQFADLRANQIAPGSWYFETVDRTLVYLPRHHAYLELPGGGEKRVRLRLELVPNHLVRASGSTVVQGAHPSDTVRLSLVEPYRWL